MHLPYTLEFVELAKDKLNRRADTPIRVFLDFILANTPVPGRHKQEQLTACGLAITALNRTPADVRQLKLTHRTMHTEDHSVGWQTGIVDHLLIGQQAIDDTAELE